MAIANAVQACRGRVRKIDDATRMKRPAVIYAHHRGLAVLEGGDAPIQRNRQRLVCGRHREHDVLLAAGGSAARDIVAVPRTATAPLAARRLVDTVATAE